MLDYAIIVAMNEWLPFIALAGLIIGLFVWLRSDIRELGVRLDKRIDEQGQELRSLGKEVAALKATVETFFRVRIDPPPPEPEQHDQAA